MSTKHSKILLASSSVYRKSLLKRILDDFETMSPDIDESQLINEDLRGMSGRLAKEKALALCQTRPNHLIIGSDQVASININDQAVQLKKPFTKDMCFEQLKLCQGKSVMFHTGLCLVNSATMNMQLSIETYETKFRSLNDQQLLNYIEREPALDCAGGFKMEGLGISLFEHIRGDDPNILVGLPLIKLIDMFNKEGFSIL